MMKTDINDNNLGYVKMPRSIMRKAWYKKSEHFHLYSHLLMKACHSNYETWFNGQSQLLKPGQLVTGRKKLSEETGINESKIERILKFLENEQQIEQQKTNTSRLITIVDWSASQKFEQQIEQQVNNERTTTEQQVNTIQEGLESKELFVVVGGDLKKVEYLKNLFAADAGLKLTWEKNFLPAAEFSHGIETWLTQVHGKEYTDMPNIRKHFLFWIPYYKNNKNGTHQSSPSKIRSRKAGDSKISDLAELNLGD